MENEVRTHLRLINHDIRSLQEEAKVLSNVVTNNSNKLDSVLEILNQMLAKKTDISTYQKSHTDTTPTENSLLTTETPIRTRRNSHVTFPSAFPIADSSPSLQIQHEGTQTSSLPPCKSLPAMAPKLTLTTDSIITPPSGIERRNSFSAIRQKSEESATSQNSLEDGHHLGLSFTAGVRQRAHSTSSLSKPPPKSEPIKKSVSLKKMSCESGIVMMDELFASSDEDDRELDFSADEYTGDDKNTSATPQPRLPVIVTPDETVGAEIDKDRDKEVLNDASLGKHDDDCDVISNSQECHESPILDKDSDTKNETEQKRDLNTPKDVNKNVIEHSNETAGKAVKVNSSESTESNKTELFVETENLTDQSKKEEKSTESTDLVEREQSMPPDGSNFGKSKAQSCAAFNTPPDMHPDCRLIKRQSSNSSTNSTNSAPGGIVMKFGSSMSEDEEEIKLPEMPPPSFTHRVVNVKMTQAKYFYDFKEHLGGGRFGRVYRCVDKKSGLHLAAKCFKCNKSRPILNNLKARSLERPRPVKILSSKRTQQEPVEKDDVTMEIAIMNQIDHENIVKLYDAFEYENSMTLILEYMAGGELFTRVLSDQSSLTEYDAILYMQQICRALQYLHKNLILHLDLKPENILCLDNTSHHIKIIDFGLSRRYTPRQKLMVRWGTPEFMAPELLNYEVVTTASDMWSVGIICYILLSGLSPFLGNNDKETMQNIVDADWDFDEEPFRMISPDAKDFISRLIVEERGGRMSAAQCLKHKWIATPMTISRKNLLQNKKELKRFMARMHWKAGVAAITAARWFGSTKDLIGEETEL